MPTITVSLDGSSLSVTLVPWPVNVTPPVVRPSTGGQTLSPHTTIQ